MMRSFDSSSSSLGPVSSWPASIRAAASICINSRYPMFIAWGPHQAMLYNDAYTAVLAAKHPRAMGRPGMEVWAEIWHIVGPLWRRVFTEGEATWAEDLLLLINRSGYDEETYFTFSYSPIREESGQVGGMFCACQETTEKVIGERRLKTLRDLAALAATARRVDDACAASMKTLAENPTDLPFALLYLVDSDGRRARLRGTAGLAAGTPASPEVVNLDTGDHGVWPLAAILQSGQAQTVDDLPARFDKLPSGPWAQSTTKAMLLPISMSGHERAAGVLVTGISPVRPVDDAYRTFFEVAAGQIASSIANARAHEEEGRRADITAIKKANEALLASESRLSAVLEQQPEGVGLFDHEGRVLLSNAILRSMLPAMMPSLDPERKHRWRSVDAAGRPIPPQQWPGARALRGESVSPGMEFTYTDDAGRELGMLVSAVPFREVGGQGNRAIVVVQDITQRRRAEQDVERFKALMDHNPSLVFLKDESGKYVYLNRAYEANFVGSKDWLGKTDFDFWPKESAELFRAHDAEVRKSGKTQQYLEDSTSLDGTRYCWLCYKFVFIDPQERKYVGGIGIDVTDRVRAEEALRDSEERFRALFENMQDGCALCQMAFDDAGQPVDFIYLAVNSAFGRLTGLENIVGKRVTEVLPGIRETYPELLLTYGRVARGGQPERFEIEFKPLAKWLTVSVYQTEPDHFAAVFDDITARKQAEAALGDALAKAEAGDRMLATLMSSVPEGITICDTAGNLRMVSRHGQDSLGGPHSEKSIEEVVKDWTVYRSDGATVMPTAELPLVRALQGEEVRDVELVQVNADGRKLPLLCNAAPLRDADGTVIAAVVAWRDITERKRAEEVLERERKQLLAIMESLDVAVGVWNTDGSMVLINDVAAKLYGFETKKQMLEHLSDYTDVQVRTMDGCELPQEEWPRSRVLRGETFSNWELEQYLPSINKRFIGSNSGRPIRDANGKIVLGVITVRDITERKKAEEQLRHNRDTIHRLIENNPMGIYAIDADFRMFEASLGARKVFANVPAPLIGRDLAQCLRTIWPEPFASEAIGRFRHTLDTGEAYVSRSTVEKRRDTGEVEAYDWHLERITLPNGRFGVVCYYYDLSERQRLEAALRSSEERLRLSQNAAGTGIHDYDVRSGHIQWDQRTRELWGVEPDEPITYDVFMACLHPEDRQAVHRTVAEALDPAGDHEYNAEYRVLNRKDGKERWVAATGDVIFDGREAVRLVGTVHDITERKQAEEALRASEERLQALVRNLPGGAAFVVDRELRYLLAEGEALREAGMQPSDLEGKTLFEALDPALAAQYEPMFRQALAGEPFAHEHEAHGRVFISRGVPLRSDTGEIHAVLALSYDVTARRQAEEALKVAKLSAEEARAAAESASKAKDDFLAVLSHELRTPLNPALMVATILENSPQLPPELREDVGIIRRNIELEARLIDDMLDLTRIARGKVTLSRGIVDGCEVLRHAVETCQAEAIEKALTLDVRYPDRPVLVDADPARLQQVFWNLLKNAIKFTPKGGLIRIGAAPTVQGGLRVEVRDTGRGIEQQNLERIFDAFEQGSTEITKHYGGIGMGLAISRSLVQMHNASIHASSDGPGKGSTFSVELPPLTLQQRPAPASGSPAPDSSRLPVSNIRILLVEDHESTAIVTARLIRSFGYQVTIANCIQAALEKFEQEPFDLLVSDLGLPDGTGHELVRQLLGKGPIRAIALSGYGMDSDIQESIQAGFLEQLVKPINVGKLKETLRRVLSAPAFNQPQGMQNGCPLE